MNVNDLSNFSINTNSTNNSSTKKKDDKEKQKTSKRGLGSLLRKSTAKEEPNTEEHTGLDTTQ